MEAEKTAPALGQAMVYHQGVPVAVCRVEGLEKERLRLACGPMRLDPDAWLILYLSEDGNPRPLGARVRASGVVEGSGSRGLLVRLDAVPAGLR